MRTAELARLTGVKASTLRFYERSGLLPLPERETSGYRRYGADHVRRVQFLRRGQELGFTLAELAELDELSSGARAGSTDQAAIASHARRRLLDIESRIADLTRMAGAITHLLAAPIFDPDAACPVIASLAGEDCTAPDVSGDTGAAGDGTSNDVASDSGAAATAPPATPSSDPVSLGPQARPTDHDTVA